MDLKKKKRKAIDNTEYCPTDTTSQSHHRESAETDISIKEVNESLKSDMSFFSPRRIAKRNSKGEVKQIPVWQVTLFNDEARNAVEEKFSHRSLIDEAEKACEIDDEEKNDINFSSQISNKIVSWVSKGKDGAKRARYELIKQKIMDICIEKGIVSEVETEPTENIPKGYPITQGVDESASIYANQDLWKKEQIRKNPVLVRAFEKWWNGLDKDINGNVNKQTYIDTLLILYSLLIPDGNTVMARQTAELDWKVDSKGQEYITWPNFIMAMFELADVWCESLELSEYVKFVKAIHKRLSDEAARQGKYFVKPYVYDNEKEMRQMLQDMEGRPKSKECYLHVLVLVCSLQE